MSKTRSVRGSNGANRQGRNSDVRLVVVGSIGLDTIRTCRGYAVDVLGGSVSYACAAASFFTRAGMVGVVGSDFPEEHLQTYRQFGLDLEGLQIARGKTFRWAGAYESDFNSRRTLRTELNVFESFLPTLPAGYRRAPFFLLGNISPRLQLHVLAQAQAPRFVLADTMDLWIEREREALRKVIGAVDLLTVNDSEAQLLTGETSLKRAAQRILKWGPRYVVVKKGEHGAILATRTGLFAIPAYPVEAVCDPTGAGDTFAGAFMGVLARRGRVSERTVREALLFASAVASFDVEDFSLKRLSRLTMADILVRFRELRKMLRVEG